MCNAVLDSSDFPHILPLGNITQLFITVVTFYGIMTYCLEATNFYASSVWKHEASNL